MSNVQLPDPEAGLCLVKPAATLVQFVHLPRVNDPVTKDAVLSELGWLATLSRPEGGLVRHDVAVTWVGGPQISAVRIEPMVAP